MRVLLLLSIFTLALTTSCKKNNSTTNRDPQLLPDTCFSNEATRRSVVNKPATIQATGGQYYIIEQNTIDTKLLPCTLSPEFRVHGLQVIVSGNVKSAVKNIPICCIDNFQLLSISK